MGYTANPRHSLSSIRGISQMPNELPGSTPKALRTFSTVITSPNSGLLLRSVLPPPRWSLRGLWAVFSPVEEEPWGGGNAERGELCEDEADMECAATPVPPNRLLRSRYIRVWWSRISGHARRRASSFVWRDAKVLHSESCS